MTQLSLKQKEIQRLLIEEQDKQSKSAHREARDDEESVIL